MNTQKKLINMDMTRRQNLAFLASYSICGLSGCINNISGSNSDGNPVYDYVEERPVYISENIDLQFAPEINRVSVIDDADMVVLSPDTQTNVEQIVSWIRNQKAVSVFGDPGGVHETWAVWRESDVYRELESEARAETTQPPAGSKTLAARWKKESIVAGSISTWGSDPDGRELTDHIDRVFLLMDEDGSLPSDATGESQSDSNNSSE